MTVEWEAGQTPDPNRPQPLAQSRRARAARDAKRVQRATAAGITDPEQMGLRYFQPSEIEDAEVQSQFSTALERLGTYAKGAGKSE